MANFTALKTAINNAIKTNGNEEITGAILQAILDAMVETLGDSAINNLETALATEVTNRENAVGGVAGDLAAEVQARQALDYNVNNRINAEEYNRQNADAALSQTMSQGFQTLGSQMTALNAAISALNAAYQNGYLYGGIATPSSSPSNNKCFYIALQGGIYTNFGGVGVVEGINIIKNDSGWKVEHIYDQTTLLNEFYLLRQQVIRAISSIDPIVIHGDVTNAPDEEDLTSDAQNLLKFKDRAYSPLNFSGLGMKILRKNIAPLSDSAAFNGFVEGVTAEETLAGTPELIFWDRMNTRFIGIKDGIYYAAWTNDDNYVPVSTSLVYMYDGTPYKWDGSNFSVDEDEVPNLQNCLTQDMINEANTIYIIRYDYTIAENITIPANCVLQFDGGSISGDYTVNQQDISVEGNYYGAGINYASKIIINKGCTLNGFKLHGYIEIKTNEKVTLNNCEIYRDSLNIQDSLIYVNTINANIEITNTKLYCINNSIRYGFYAPNQMNALVISDCEFYGMREIAVNCSSRILSCLVEGNHIHDIGYANTLLANSIGVRINKNLDDNNPDYTLYDGMSIVIRNNIIERLISYYTTENDACEGHGVLVYGNNVIIENNIVKDLLSGEDNEHLSIYCGAEHEGIYVKGDYCTIVNNTLINACGNAGSEGAIAVKWNGLGGTICNNKIIQSFGNGIWTQCRNVRISDNYICYIQDENSQSLTVDRYYCIYNTVTPSALIPIHQNRKYTSIVENNNIELRDVSNYIGFVFSFDGGSDDLQINNNKVECTGFIQILRNSGGGTTDEKEKIINFNNNIIRKPYPVKTGNGITQIDIQVNTSNTENSSDTFVNFVNNRFSYYNIQDANHECYVIRNYTEVSSNMIFRFSNNIFEAPNKTTIRFNCYLMELNNSIKKVEFSDNIFNLYLRGLFYSLNADKTTDLYIRNNQFGVISDILVFSELTNTISKVNDFIFINNVYDRSSSITMQLINIPNSYDLSQHGRLLDDLMIFNNVYRICNISNNANYVYISGGDKKGENNYPSTLNI